MNLPNTSAGNFHFFRDEDRSTCYDTVVIRKAGIVLEGVLCECKSLWVRIDKIAKKDSSDQIAHGGPNQQPTEDAYPLAPFPVSKQKGNENS
jgi:hypothetical protein